jgi:hypothetical protein
MDKTNYLYNASDRLIRLYDDLTQYALDDIVKRLLEHGVITGTSEYRIWKLQQMGLHLDKIRLYIAGMTGKSNKEVDRIFKEYGIKYYKSVSKIAIDYGQHIPLTLETSQLMSDVFSYYVASTKGTINNLTRTTANSSQQLLINKLDQVHFRVVSGMQSYSQAISEAINEIGESQLEVQYPTGVKRTIETAIRQSIVTGVNKCFTDLNLVRAKENGYNHVLVSSHLGARHIDNPIPEYLSHDIWQGKIFALNYEEIPIMNIRGLI